MDFNASPLCDDVKIVDNGNPACLLFSVNHSRLAWNLNVISASKLIGKIFEATMKTLQVQHGISRPDTATADPVSLRARISSAQLLNTALILRGNLLLRCP